MVNISEKHLPHMWNKWEKAGALGNISMARARERSVSFVNRLLNLIDQRINREQQTTRGAGHIPPINRFIRINGENSEPESRILVSVYSQSSLYVPFESNGDPSIELDDGRRKSWFRHPNEACSMGIWIDKSNHNPQSLAGATGFFLVHNGELYQDVGRHFGHENPPPESGVASFRKISLDESVKVVKLAAQALSSHLHAQTH